MNPQDQETIEFVAYESRNHILIPQSPLFPSDATRIEEGPQGTWHFSKPYFKLTVWPESHVREFLSRPENDETRKRLKGVAITNPSPGPGEGARPVITPAFQPGQHVRHITDPRGKIGFVTAFMSTRNSHLYKVVWSPTENHWTPDFELIHVMHPDKQALGTWCKGGSYQKAGTT